MSEVQALLGRVITGVVPERDAIHIAVMPVFVGADYLNPGSKVKFTYGSRDTVVSARTDYGEDAIGVIDPFLKLDDYQYSINKGERVWLYLYPNTVDGMRHHWHHPIVDAPHTTESEDVQWLRRYAEEEALDYNEMMKIAQHGDDYMISRGQDTNYGVDRSEFWRRVEVVLGQTFSAEHKESVGWSCSC